MKAMDARFFGGPWHGLRRGVAMGADGRPPAELYLDQAVPRPGGYRARIRRLAYRRTVDTLDACGTGLIYVYVPIDDDDPVLPSWVTLRIPPSW